MLLNPCITQTDKYSFLIKDITTAQRYDAAGVDLTNVTAATLTIKKAYLPTSESTYTIDILDDWAYLLGDGLSINIVDLEGNLFDGYDHWIDWFYTFVVTYTYNGRVYTATRTVGFRDTITQIVMKQLQQSDWIKELGCGCEKASTSLRKFNYLKLLEIASENCLIMQYQEILLALYKLTGTVHEYSS